MKNLKDILNAYDSSRVAQEKVCTERAKIALEFLNTRFKTQFDEMMDEVNHEQKVSSHLPSKKWRVSSLHVSEKPLAAVFDVNNNWIFLKVKIQPNVADLLFYKITVTSELKSDVPLTKDCYTEDDVLDWCLVLIEDALHRSLGGKHD